MKKDPIYSLHWIVLLLLFMVLTHTVQAQNSSLVLPTDVNRTEDAKRVDQVKRTELTTESTSTISISDLQKKSSSKNYSLSAGLNSFGYQSYGPQQPRTENQFTLGSDFHDQFGAVDFKSRVVFGGYSSPDKTYFVIPEPALSQTYFAVPEMYFFRSYASTQTEIYMGRVVLKSSQMDRSLHLGLTQPFLTQDFIHFEDQGMTGFQIEQKAHDSRFELGFFPLYFPNQEPTVAIENGQAQPTNRWAKVPPSRFIFNNQEKDIVYSMESYSLMNIVMHPTSRIAWSTVLSQQATGKTDIAVQFRRGPINEISLNRATYADLDVVGQVKLSPKVIYSRNTQIELSQSYGPAQVSLAYFADNPENEKAESGRALQNLGEMTGAGLRASYGLPEDVFPIEFYFGFSRIWGGDINDVNADGSPNLFTFTKHRQQYFEPLQLGFKWQSIILSKDIVWELNWISDQVQKGALLSGIAQLQYNRYWQIHAGFDVLGSDLPADDDNSYFLHKNRANDRFFGGVRYVF